MVIQQNSAANSQHGQLPEGAVGVRMRDLSGRMPRPATGDGLGLQRQVVLMRWGGLPVARPMRGDIDDTSVRCLYGCWVQPSGFLRHAGESLTYFMVVAPIVRSLGRQWPPIEAALECRSTPFDAIDVRVFATIRLLWKCFFMTRRHSDTASPSPWRYRAICVWQTCKEKVRKRLEVHPRSISHASRWRRSSLHSG